MKFKGLPDCEDSKMADGIKIIDDKINAGEQNVYYSRTWKSRKGI